MNLTKSSKQSKEWRKTQDWYINGKHNECEKYQKSIIQKITSKDIPLTYDRINMENCSIVECPHPMKNNDGYEYTENFDGKQHFDGKIMYYNLKFVCDNGGAQTRTLRETYLFIKHQLSYISKNNLKNVYFINILDGDGSSQASKHFEYLLSKHTCSYVFCGDMLKFKEWWDLMQNNKKTFGQFYTTNTKKILQGFHIPTDITICEPFVGTGEMIEYAKSLGASCFEMYDIEPKYPNVEVSKRDTLDNPPEFSGKFVLTNPPYLARNKNNTKTIYDKYSQNDLYKCFIRILIDNVCDGGIIIIPLNFWCSIRKSDKELRRDFLKTYKVLKVNVFEEQVFEDTSYTVCSFLFTNKKTETEKDQEKIPFLIFPENKTIQISITKPYWSIGSEIYTQIETKYVVKRWVNEDKCNTNILLHALDSGSNSSKKISLEICDKPIRSKESDRTFASLIITPEISIEQQWSLVNIFNEYITTQRQKYNSLFLSNYREHGRKRISFDLVYIIIQRLLSIECDI